MKAKKVKAPYHAYSAYLRERHGEKVRRISLDAGFGCPHRDRGRGAGGCIYCGPSGSGTGAWERGVSVREQMEQGIRALSRQGVTKYIAYFQAFCGTGGDPGKLRRIYGSVLDFPGLVGLSVGTRPDQVPGPVLSLLAELGAAGNSGKPLDLWLELGLQSAHDDTLRRINRRHDVACFDDAVTRADAAGLKTAAHVILGLPGEDEEQMMATARHLSRLPVKGLKLHHLYVERGSALEALRSRREYRPLSLDEYVRLAVGFLRRTPPQVVIMRLAGRAHRDRLISPPWSLDSGAVAQRIEREMKGSGYLQGDLLRPAGEGK